MTNNSPFEPWRLSLRKESKYRECTESRKIIINLFSLIWTHTNLWMLKSFFTVVSLAVITVTISSGFVLQLWCVNWMLKGLGNLCFHWQDFLKIPREPRMSLLYSQFKQEKTFVCSETQMLGDLNAERLWGRYCRFSRKDSKTQSSEP